LGTHYTDIAVRGSIDNVRNLVQTAFGALAQYYGVDFEIGSTPEGAVLRFIKANTGWAGGYLGARRVEKKFEELGNLMTAWFQQQGVLVGRKTG
jgi:hypothetical protein